MRTTRNGAKLMGRNAPSGRPKGTRQAATPRYRTGHDSKRAVLAAAAEVMVTDGYAAFSMNRVASRAGMRLANVQYYFPTRHELVHALLSDIFSRFRESVPVDAPGESSSVAEQLERMLDWIMQSNSDPADCAVVWSAWAIAAHDPKVNEILDRWYIEYRRFFYDLIRRAQPRVAPRKAHRLAAMCAAVLEGSSLQIGAGKKKHAELQGFDADVKDMIRRLVLGK
jgi:AcrR family transcriptional regulator